MLPLHAQFSVVPLSLFQSPAGRHAGATPCRTFELFPRHPTGWLDAALVPAVECQRQVEGDLHWDVWSERAVRALWAQGAYVWRAQEHVSTVCGFEHRAQLSERNAKVPKFTTRVRAGPIWHGCEGFGQCVAWREARPPLRNTRNTGGAGRGSPRCM